MTRLPVSLFFALFTVSGFAGLIYESIWSHYLKLFLGHAAYAQTLVLAIFMGGMAIGSWLVSRFTSRIRNLLLGYALAELGIGVLAIAFHRVFGAAVGWAFEAVLPSLQGGSADAFKWALGSLLILPASILLGTTFPLMSGGILRRYPETGGRALSMLYFTNSFGAALGVLASGFVMIDRLGLPGTILVAGMLNIVLALVVWLLARRVAEPDVAAASGAPVAGGGEGGLRLGRLVLLLAFVTGAASFMYEIGWIRMLTLGLGASTHAFEVMLAAFILAMSLGAFWLRNRMDRVGNDLAWLAALLIAKALFAVYALWAYPGVLGFLGWTLQAVARTDGGYTLNTLAGLAASMAVMFPAAFCAGMTLPLATRALTARGHGEASIGRVYGANTAGCIVGAIVATHVGMEVLGVKGLTGLGAVCDAASALALLALGAGRIQWRRAVALGVVAIAGLVAFFAAPLDLLRMASGVYRHGVFIDAEGSALPFYRDGKTATIAVVDTPHLRSIRTNGKPDASVTLGDGRIATPDETTMLMAAALPLAVRPDAKLVANIGFGSGLTTHGLLGSPRIERLDSIEIERMMIEGARLFQPLNRRAYDDPRSRIHIEDAKTFFASAGTRYDVIVSEPSNPWVSGVSTLFSEEFYRSVKRYLKPDGLLVQWVQTYETDVGLLASVFKALGGEFADYVVYRTDVDLLVVAVPTGKVPALRADLFSYPGVREDLARLGYHEVGDIEALRLGNRALLQPYFARSRYPANSDYFPVIDQRAPRARFRNQTAGELARLPDALAPVVGLLDREARSPLEAAARAGPNRPARIDRAMLAAEAIGVSLSGAADAARRLPASERAMPLLVHGLLADCSHARDEWLKALTWVVARASPVLEAPAIAPLFAKVRGSRCHASLDPAGQRWVAWLAAVSDRDPVQVQAHGTALLAAMPPALEAERGTVLAATLAAALARGQAGEAAALRDRHFRELGAPARGDLTLAVVLARLDELAPPGAR